MSSLSLSLSLSLQIEADLPCNSRKGCPPPDRNSRKGRAGAIQEKVDLPPLNVIPEKGFLPLGAIPEKADPPWSAIPEMADRP